MQHYVGIDVSMKKSSVCIIDEKGNRIQEFEVKTDPHLIVNAIEKTKLDIELLGFESGSLSHFLMQGFRERGAPAVCVDARKMSAILSINVNKTDKNDARGIAQALKAGMFTRVHEKPKKAIDQSSILTMRRCLVNQRKDMKNHIRGILKTYGIRMGSVGPTKFSESVKIHADVLDPLVFEMVEGMTQIFDVLCEKLLKIDTKLVKIAGEDRQVRRLMTIPGIGPITALTYQSTIFDPSRFKKSRSVGAYLGMTPKQYSSGETCKFGSISKCGSKELRSLLNESGIVLLTRTKKWSKLKAWGLKLLRKKGTKKAALAVGRKLAVIMHRMLVEETDFIYGEEKKKAA